MQVDTMYFLLQYEKFGSKNSVYFHFLTHFEVNCTFLASHNKHILEHPLFIHFVQHCCKYICSCSSSEGFTLLFSMG